MALFYKADNLARNINFILFNRSLFGNIYVILVLTDGLFYSDSFWCSEGHYNYLRLGHNSINKHLTAINIM